MMGGIKIWMSFGGFSIHEFYSRVQLRAYLIVMVQI